MVTKPSDRTVHGVSADGWEIVRYDRSGKWYMEHILQPRRLLTVSVAAELLAEVGATWREGQPGGKALDAKARRLREADRV